MDPQRLLVDDRIGSRDLVPRLRQIGVPAKLTRLPFADAAFVGRGLGERPWSTGIELKTISDLCSCILTSRFAAHQLPGLLRDYDDVWLVVEGRWRASREGVLEVDVSGHGRWFRLAHGRQRWMARDVMGYLTSMAVLGGVRIWHTETRDETARFVAMLYHWWTEKRLDQHDSLHTFVDYKRKVGGRAAGRGADPVLLAPPSFARRVFKELPGCGWERSREIEAQFPTVFEAVLAGERDWARIPGIGRTLARQIVQAWQQGSARARRTETGV